MKVVIPGRREAASSSFETLATLAPQDEDLTLAPRNEDLTPAPQDEDLTLAPQDEDLTPAPQDEDLTLAPRNEDLTLRSARSAHLEAPGARRPLLASLRSDKFHGAGHQAISLVRWRSIILSNSASDPALEIGPDLIDIAELGERPAAIGAEMVHAGHPIGVHGQFLFLGVLAPIALDLDHQIERIAGPAPIIHLHDEIGQVFPRLRAVAIGHFQTEVVILGVGDDLWVRLGNAAELRLPVAVEHDPVDMVSGGGPLVSQRSVRDVLKRTCRVEPVWL